MPDAYHAAVEKLGESSKKTRRVPESERQRARVSCDRCKARKVRCIRLPQARPNEPCAACAQLGVQCQQTHPRKHRTFLTATSEHHYQALRGLVSQLFPGEANETSEDIATIIRKERSRRSALSTGQDIGPIPEGRLIPSIHGVYHYVGPSSSYMFANTIRVLVSKVARQHNPFQPVEAVPQHRAARFSSHNRTSALDARIRGHPNTSVTDEQPQITSPESFSINNSIDLLPDRHTSDRLVQTFFSRVHPNFVIFHHGTFYARYEELWKHILDGQALPTKPADSGWLCSLFLVFVLSAQALGAESQIGADEIQRKYLTRVLRERLAYLLVTSSLDNVQCLMLLALYQHNVGERNTAWIIIGQASRMAIALGIQRQGNCETFGVIERTQRQLVWWTLHLFEQNLCFILGRPGSTEAIEVTVDLPNEEYMDGNDMPLGLLRHEVSLSTIAFKIKRLIARISPLYDRHESILADLAVAQGLLAELDSWFATLPEHLRSPLHSSSPRHYRAVTLLQLQYAHLKSAVGRPFLLALVDSQVEDQSIEMVYNAPLVDLVRTCLENANQVCDYLQTLATRSSIEGEVWSDFFYAHHSALILCLPSLYRLVPGATPFVKPAKETVYRSTVARMIELGLSTRLAPTYRILMDVSMQFAKITGVLPGSDDLTRPPSPRLPVGLPPEPFSADATVLQAPMERYPQSATEGDYTPLQPPKELEWLISDQDSGIINVPPAVAQGWSLEQLLGLETGQLPSTVDNSLYNIPNTDPLYDLLNFSDTNWGQS